MMKNHSMLSASGASRWLNCTPSAVLEKEFVDSQVSHGGSSNPSSSYADEGTFAHALAEYVIKEKGFGVDMTNKIRELVDSEWGQMYYNKEMQDYIDEYADFVVKAVREASDGAILIQEQELDLTEYIPDGKGTTDICIVANDWLWVIDLKYGKGVPVSAENNKQLMVYALGSLMEYDLLYNIHSVRMTVYQPRIENISSFEIGADELVKWGRQVLRPAAIEAYNGRGELVAGDHCRFCKVKAVCKENAKHNLALAARAFDPPLLEPDQMAKIIMNAKKIKAWITAVEQYALQEAIKGTKWPGLKVVVGRSNRKYSNEEEVLKMLIKEGYDGEQLVNKKLLGITNLSKKVSKLHFQSIVEPLLIKPPGSPALVSEEDNRPEFNSTEAASLEFEVLPDETDN